MYNIINDFEKWLNSSDKIILDLKHDIESLDDYSIENELFFYDENMVKEKLLRNSIFMYFNRVEEYIKKYIEQFSFNSYENLNHFSKNMQELDIVYFLDWMKEENLISIKEFVEESNRDRYDVNALYNALRYYDYLIVENLENDNCESAMNFLVDFIESVMNKVNELSIQKKTKTIKEKIDDILRRKTEKAKIIEDYLVIKTDQYTTNEFTNNLESADKQAFYMKLAIN